jgi:histidinol-phosphatase
VTASPAIPPAIPDVVAAMIRAAEAAGEIAMKYYRGGFEVTIKADQTPVTQADREAEQAIKAVLRRAYPDHGFLGEELGEEGPKERRFIIDPIDGTQNFIRRVPIWARCSGRAGATGRGARAAGCACPTTTGSTRPPCCTPIST